MAIRARVGAGAGGVFLSGGHPGGRWGGARDLHLETEEDKARCDRIAGPVSGAGVCRPARGHPGRLHLPTTSAAKSSSVGGREDQSGRDACVPPALIVGSTTSAKTRAAPH